MAFYSCYDRGRRQRTSESLAISEGFAAASNCAHARNGGSLRETGPEIMHRVETAAPAFFGHSEQAKHLRRTICRVAEVPAHVLVVGETGTGKELIARCLHAGSGRSDGPFIPVSCRATLPESLESDIFGRHDRSSGSRPGKLDLARLGTLFLQDAECLPLPVQVKLSRALQDDRICCFGSNVPVQDDVRVVASTTVDIRQLCASGEFLSELYWCLSIVRIVTPPLREIREDIPVLFELFLSQAADRYQREIPDGHADLVPQLIAHSWPGNADELRNAADRLLIGIGGGVHSAPKSLPEQVDHFEKQLIVHCLDRQRGSVSAASEELSIPKTTLYDKLRKYGISPEAFASGARADTIRDVRPDEPHGEISPRRQRHALSGAGSRPALHTAI
jgi:DNA-binding NtrC family response regulator